MTVVLTILAIIGLLLVLVVAALVGFFAWARRRQGKALATQEGERRQYAEWAAEHRMEYAERDDGWLPPLTGHRPFVDFSPQQGAFSQARHVFSDETDGSARAFLELTVSADPRPGARPNGYFTVAAVRHASPVPAMLLLPNGRNGGDGATGHAAFDRVYSVKCSSPADVQAVLVPEVLDWLAELPSAQRPSFHLEGEWATCFLSGPLVFERGKLAFDALVGLMERLPRHG